MAKSKHSVLPVGADECIDSDGSVREPYIELLGAVTGMFGDLPAISRNAQEWFLSRDVTFGVPVDGVAPIFPFDPIPRVIGASEWRTLHRALAQRAVALEHVVSGSLVYSSTGYLRDIVGIRPPRSTWCHVSGIDVVRVHGTFCVLEDNVRIPSGVAYALEARRAMEHVAPGWFATNAVRR